MNKSLTVQPLTILIPCLNESRTIGKCVAEAKNFLDRTNIPGEVLVIDNGSTDDSIQIAREFGARVEVASMRGYGVALRLGIKMAQNDLIIFGDGDWSYDFSSLDEMYELLIRRADLVIGNRFLGGIEPGAMPKLNRIIGNPFLTRLGQILFETGIGDFHCGLRSSKEFI